MKNNIYKTHKIKLLTNNKLFVSIILYLFLYKVSVAQLPSFEPVFPTIEPTPLGKSYNPNNPFPDQWDYLPQLKNPLQYLLEAELQKTQMQNVKTIQQFAIPIQPTIEERKNPMAYDKQVQSKQKLTEDLFNEIKFFGTDNLTVQSQFNHQELYKKLHVADIGSNEYKNTLLIFKSAYAEIKQMLDNQKPLSLKRAVFLVENSYSQNKLSYDNYCNQISEIKTTIIEILKKNNVDVSNKVELQKVLQNLYQSSFKFKSTTDKNVNFIKLSYDFDDYLGYKDYKKQFVTKLLNTHTGQCHSLPLLYLILCEELGLEAYLALAPNHSYIKFPYNGNLYCFETTSGAFTDNDFVVKSGYINATAISNQIYLAPQTKSQTVATCLNDLASAFEELVGKSDFSFELANTTLKYYPNSVYARLIMTNIQIAYCAKVASKYNFPKENELDKYPMLKEQFNSMVNWESNLEELGYTKIPKDEYERWLKEAEEMKRQQDEVFNKNKK